MSKLFKTLFVFWMLIICIEQIQAKQKSSHFSVYQKPYYLLNKAKKEGSHTRYQKQIRKLEENYPHFSKRDLLLDHLGTMQFIKGNYKASLGYYDKLRKLFHRSPLSIKANYYVALNRIHQGQLKNAKQEIDKQLQQLNINHSYYDHFILLRNAIDLHQGQYKKIIQHYQNPLSMKQANPLHLQQLLKAQITHNQIKNAFKTYRIIRKKLNNSSQTLWPKWIKLNSTITTDIPNITNGRNQKISSYWIQLAAFSNKNNALQLQQKLSSITSLSVIHIELEGQRFYFKVKIGPIQNKLDLNRIKKKLKQHGQSNLIIKTSP